MQLRPHPRVRGRAGSRYEPILRRSSGGWPGGPADTADELDRRYTLRAGHRGSRSSGSRKPSPRHLIQPFLPSQTSASRSPDLGYVEPQDQSRTTSLRRSDFLIALSKLRHRPYPSRPARNRQRRDFGLSLLVRSVGADDPGRPGQQYQAQIKGFEAGVGARRQGSDLDMVVDRPQQPSLTLKASQWPRIIGTLLGNVDTRPSSTRHSPYGKTGPPYRERRRFELAANLR